MPLDSTSSMRSYDQDGRLHVRVSHISKANICPYRGNEIPEWQSLGLDPDKIYRLLRDPEELAKAAPTFNNLQILSRHIPVSANEPNKDKTVGSTGTDAVFNDPYLDNSLVFWDAEAIAGVESGSLRELSSAYHYDADMTPGSFKGEPYDGVMRNIRGNHVAQVEAGRAGNDVVVMDSALETDEWGPEHTVPNESSRVTGDSQLETNMSKRQVTLSPRAAVVKGALIGYLGPKMAQDKKMPDFGTILAGLEGTWAKQKPQIAARAVERTKGLLAQDASIADISGLLDRLDNTGGEMTAPALAAPTNEVVATPDAETLKEVLDGDPEKTNNVAEDDDIEMKVRELLQGKLDDADLQMLLKLIRPEGQEDPDPDNDGEVEQPAPATKPDTTDDEFPDNLPQKEKPVAVTKPAMDAAIRAASERATQEAVRRTTERLNALHAAQEDVRPHVGRITVAMDTAADVYRFALEQKGVKLDGVPATGLKPMFMALAPTWSQGGARAQTRIAQDAAAVKGFGERFPGAARMRVVG